MQSNYKDVETCICFLSVHSGGTLLALFWLFVDLLKERVLEDNSVHRL